MKLSESFRAGSWLGVAVCLIVALLVTVNGVSEEVAVATVVGTARIAPDGAPAANAEIHIEAYSPGADLAGLVTMRTVSDSEGRFVVRNVPVGFTTVRAYAPGYSTETFVNVSSGAPEVDLSLRWEGDQLELATNQPVFTPDERPTLVLNGLTRLRSVKLSVFAFDDKDIFEKRDTYALTRNIAYNRYWGDRPEGDEPKPTQEIEHRLQSQDIQGKFAETVQLPEMEEGLYVVRAETDGVVRHQWINVSKIGLVTKVSPSGVLGYVVDIATGKPLEGLPIFVVGPSGRKELGRTGPDGTVSSAHSGATGSYVMVATNGSSRAFAMYDRWQDEDGRATAVHIQTDRPVYRPGDTVHYKGFVRVPTRAGFKLPSSRSAQVSILDPDGTEIHRSTKALSALGGLDGSFEALPELVGSYQIQIEIDGQTHTEWVSVSAYRKPEFRITVSPTEPYYIAGQTTEFKIKAEFFTGEPVVGARLNAYAYRSQVWKWSAFDDEEYAWWFEGEDAYDSYGGEYVGDFEAVTDDNGEATIRVRTDASGAQGTAWTSDMKYTLQVTGQDASGRGFDSKGSVDVVRGDVELTVAFEDYVVGPNEPAKIRLRATHYGSKKPADGAKIALEFGSRVWTGSTTEERKEGTRSVTLDRSGEGFVSLTPKQNGEFYVRATTKDSKGRSVVTHDYIWVYRSGARLQAPAPTLQVVLDKKSYAVGEQATAVVRTSKPGGSALVTIEAEDVQWTKVVPLTSETTSVSVPVTDLAKPNALVNVCYIREKAFAQSSRWLVVDMGQDRLEVEVTPDVAETLPGGTVSYLVSTKDADGRPVSADVALSVVDEGVYSIREDRKDPVRSFYPSRWSSVGTYFSFPEVYLDGEDKDALSGELRTEFKDTAFWAPSVETGSDGTAKVTIQLPDNLTSWRATATAVTEDAKAGKGTSNVIARKPVMVRASLPAFMVQDESQQIGVTVRNETDSSKSIDVRFQGFGVTVNGNAVQRVEIGARSSKTIDWKVTAVTPGEARVRVTAVATKSGENDGLERSFDVVTNGPTVEDFAAGSTQDSAQFSFVVDADALQGSLEVSLTPSLLGGIVGSLDDLVDYPYGCVEQTMSRFLPAVVVQRFLRDSGSARPDLDAKIAEVSLLSQARLRSMQNGSGGFGWFAYDEGDAGMTALVLEGLYWAKEAGVDVNPHLRDRALEWAKNYASNRANVRLRAEDHARLAYALSLHKVPGDVWLRLLPTELQNTTNELTLAYTVLALDTAKVNKDLADQAYQTLLSRGSESETALSWSDEFWYEPTAVATLAVVKREPGSVRASKCLRYLMGRRKGNSWTSTRDTAQIVLAAVEYLRSTNELRPNFEARLIINGNRTGVYKFVASELSKTESIRVPVASLKKGRNEIVVQFSGQGTVYYSAKLVQQVYDADPRPVKHPDGLSIKREFFRMQAVRLEDGTRRLMPSKNPVTSASQGEVLRCRITVTSDRERRFVMVKDPALSNARAIDAGFVDPWEWHYWWSDQSFFDDHTAIFMSYLNKGENIVEYSVRAEAVGRGIALPATVSAMYQPDIWAATGTARLEVRP